MSVATGNILRISPISPETWDYFDLPMPLWGYKTTIKLPFTIAESEDGLYDIWDNGATYDNRSCSCEFLLTEAQQLGLLGTLTNSAKGRGKACQIEMVTGSGFFPFGCDKGDKGAFECVIKILSTGSAQPAPYGYFRIMLGFYFTGSSYPAYTFPIDEPDRLGSLTLGTVSGIPQPQSWTQAKINYNINTVLAHGVNYNIRDKTDSSLNRTTVLSLNLRNAKACRLLNYLTVTIRGESFIATFKAGLYPFGRDVGNAGDYMVKMIQDTIEITHSGYNQHLIELTLGYGGGYNG